MIGFGIDEIQAEYVAEIKLRHLNREYILKRISDIEALENEIAELEKVAKRQKAYLRDDIEYMLQSTEKMLLLLQAANERLKNIQEKN